MRIPRSVIIGTIALALGACGDNDKSKGKSAAPAAKPKPIVSAPAKPDTPPTGRPKTGTNGSARTAPSQPIEVYKPGGFHVDDGKVEYYKPKRRRPIPRPKARRIYLNLLSSPPGALAFVDGERIGRTPAYWETVANGKPRNFTFVLSGYAMQRYRFVPVTNGTVHAKLDKVVASEPDAGIAAHAPRP